MLCNGQASVITLILRIIMSLLHRVLLLLLIIIYFSLPNLQMGHTVCKGSQDSPLKTLNLKKVALLTTVSTTTFPLRTERTSVSAGVSLVWLYSEVEISNEQRQPFSLQPWARVTRHQYWYSESPYGLGHIETIDFQQQAACVVPLYFCRV